MKNLRSLHPTPVQIFWLWQACSENVNSLTKVLHVQVTQQRIVESTANLDNISPRDEALMFAIYLSAMMSVTNEESLRVMGEPAHVCIERFTSAAQSALSNAGLLSSADMTLLQAFTLFIVGIRNPSAAKCSHFSPVIDTLTRRCSNHMAYDWFSREAGATTWPTS